MALAAFLSHRWFYGITAAVLGALVYLAYYNTTYNGFYFTGAGLDNFYYSSMLWRGNLMIEGPRSYNIGSFYNLHFSPLLLIPVFISHLVSGDHITFYSGFIGIAHAALALVVYWLTFLVLHAGGNKLNKYITNLICLIMACGVVFSGMVGQFGWLPHYESYFPVFIIACLVFLALDKLLFAALCFAATVLLREDGGFHIAVYLAALMAAQLLLQKFDYKGLWKRYRLPLLAILAGLGCGILAFMVPDLMGVEKYSLLQQNYVGNSFGHITWESLGERLAKHWNIRLHIIAPPALLLIAGIAWRQWYYIIGALAFIPWYVVCLVSKYEVIWSIDIYYCFPFLVTLVWPLIAYVWQTHQGPKLEKASRAKKRALILQAVMLVFATSFLNPQDPGKAYSYMYYARTKVSDNHALYTQFANALAHDRTALGRLRSANGVIGIQPYYIDRIEWLDGGGYKVEPDGPLDSVLVFVGAGDCREALRLARVNELSNFYWVPGTYVLIATNRRLANLMELRKVMQAVSVPDTYECLKPADLWFFK